jgi:hypothetical protein
VANPDCSPVEGYEVKTTLEPKHGKIEFVTSSDYASWSKDNVRFKCNEKKLRGTDWVYQSNDGYRGDDEFEVTIFTPNGTMVERHYNLNVR